MKESNPEKFLHDLESQPQYQLRFLRDRGNIMSLNASRFISMQESFVSGWTAFQRLHAVVGAGGSYFGVIEITEWAGGQNQSLGFVVSQFNPGKYDGAIVCGVIDDGKDFDSSSLRYINIPKFHVAKKLGDEGQQIIISNADQDNRTVGVVHMKPTLPEPSDSISPLTPQMWSPDMGEALGMLV